MSLDTERAVIEKRWQAGWVADNSSNAMTPSQFEGVPFTQPADIAWARLTVRHGEAFQASAGDPGNNVFRHPGVVMIQLFAPTSKGTKELRTLGELAGKVFRAKRVDNILFRTPSFALLDSDGPWARAMVKVPFYRDELY